MQAYIRKDGTVDAIIPTFEEKSLTLAQMIVEAANSYARREAQESFYSSPRTFKV